MTTERAGGLPQRALRPGARRGWRWGGRVLAWLLTWATASAAAAAPPPPRSTGAAAGGSRQAGDAAATRDARLLETYRKMLAEDPTQPYPLRRLLEVSHVVGGVPGLVRLYRQEVRDHPRRYAAWLVLGHLLAAAEQGAEALDAYGEAARVAPKKAAPFLGQAAVFKRRLDWGEALGAYDRAIALVRGRQAKQDALKAAADAALRARQLGRADAYYEALFKTEPHNLYLRMERAGALARMGEDRRAVEAWEDVRDRAKGDLATYVIVCKELGPLQMQLGDLDAAEATWRGGLKRLARGHWARPAMLEGLASVFRRRGALDALLRELKPEASGDLLVALMVAALHEELGHDKEALATLQAARSRWPRDARVRRRLVALVERTGTPAEVLEAYRALVRATPGEPRQELRLAELYLTQGHSAEGMKRLASVSRRYRQDPGVHRAVIDLIMRYGGPKDRPRVEAEYRVLRKLEPREPAHVISLGEYYWASGRRHKARDVWRELLTVARSEAEGWFSLAEVYADHRLVAEAVAAYRHAIQLAPAEERYVKAYALLLEQQHQYGPALDKWLRLLDTRRSQRARGAGGATHPGLTDARKHIVELWDRGGRLDGEMKRLGALMDRAPPDLEAGRTLAVALQHRRDLPAARRLLERILAVAPRDLESLRQLESILERLNEPRGAIGLLERLAELDTRGAAHALRRAADLALGLGRQADTLRFMRRVVELDPANAKARVEVGDLYRRMGHLAEAAKAWRQALALDPRDQPVRLRLATLYRQQGDTRREARLLLELVERARDPAVLMRAGRRLLALSAASVAQGAPALATTLDEVLRTLARARPDRPVYGQLLVELYDRTARAVDRSERPASARREALRALGARALKPLLDALASQDTASRAAAVRVLGLTRPPGAAPALARLVEAGDSLLSLRALAALGSLGGATATAALVRAVTGGPQERRVVALWALGLVGTPAAADVLAERLTKGRTSHRALAALALGMCAGSSGDRTLRRLARESPAAQLRRHALWALAVRRDEATVATFAGVLGRGATNEAILALWGLSRLSSPAARRALVGALWSPSPEVRVAAGAALRAWGTTGARRTAGADGAVASAQGRVARTYRAGLDPERGRLRGSWPAELDALARTPPARARALVDVLVDAREDVARAMERAMTQGRESLDLLRGLDAGAGSSLGISPLAPRGEALGEAAARALVSIVGPLTPRLAGLARTGRSAEVRATALRVWARTVATASRVGAEGDLPSAGRRPALVQAALAALAQERGRARAAGAWALGWAGDVAEPPAREAVEEAVGALDGGSPAGGPLGVALVAAARAVRAGRESWRALLRAADPETRAAAAAALGASVAEGWREGEALGEDLLDLLDDDSPDVRAAALKASVAMGPAVSTRARRLVEARGDLGSAAPLEGRPARGGSAAPTQGPGRPGPQAP